MNKIIILITLILICKISFADPYEEYWEKIRAMKYEDQVVEVDGEKYIENSLYKEDGNLFEENKKIKKKEKKETGYMSEGSLVPKDFKGLFEEE